MFFGITVLVSCSGNNDESVIPQTEVDLEYQVTTSSRTTNTVATTTTTQVNSVSEQYMLSDIDLNNWKVTLPVGNPTSFRPPEILEYATNSTLKPFFYNDSIDGSLVFYAYPANTTPNSSYSRTELREQVVSGSDHTNWTFSQGGRLRGVLSVPEVTYDSSGNQHKIIVMQIHGRLTDAQRSLIGANDNNAPPILKIYWDKGRIRIKTKQVKDLSDSYEDLLQTSAWGDDDGYTFPVDVNDEKFTLEVIVTDERMEVILNEDHSVVYDDIHIQKWGIFENYFKAGNYFQSRDSGSFARVKYYELEVSHN